MKSAATNETYLFVYGTLRKDINHPMHQMFSHYATFIGMGSFQGKLYNLGRYPAVVISRKKSDSVFGEVYRLEDPFAVFKILDEYEGQHFRRETVAISLDRAGPIRSWIYLYTQPVSGRKLIASGDYVKYRV